MNRLLQDLRIVEISAFVAAPLGSMTMAQMGAEVIRIDPIGGGIDFARWPVTRDGASLYWTGLNKAKRSLALALDKPEGRDLARAIITAPGPGAGIFLTNLPPSRGLDFTTLKASREDLIMLRLVGNRDGSAAVVFLTAQLKDGKSATDLARFASTRATLAIYMPGADYAEVAARLLDAGLPADTTCALISQATCAGQQIRWSDIGALFEEQKLPAPAVLIVGRVATQDVRSIGEKVSAVSFGKSEIADVAPQSWLKN